MNIKDYTPHATGQWSYTTLESISQMLQYFWLYLKGRNESMARLTVEDGWLVMPFGKFKLTWSTYMLLHNLRKTMLYWQDAVFPAQYTPIQFCSPEIAMKADEEMNNNGYIIGPGCLIEHSTGRTIWTFIISKEALYRSTKCANPFPVF